MSKRYTFYALAVIAIANFFSYLDRQLISALETPIREAFNLDTAAFGALWTAFTVGYMVCSPFIGYLSDRNRRPRLFSVCIFIWSFATIASGLAGSAWILYPARVLIGLGEAGCLVIGSSLIADYFSKETRGRALSIFYLGLPIGGTAAFIMAGNLLDVVGWRGLFYIAGIPGFILVVLIWMLVDPPRGTGEGSKSSPGKLRFKDYVELLKTPSLLLIIFAQAFAVVILVPITHYGVEFFITARDMEPNDARNALGIVALIAGIAGIGLSGILGDRLSRKLPGAYALIAGISFLAGFPAILVGLMAESRWVFLPALTAGAFCIFFCMPALNTQIANVVRPTQRAMAWALAVFILHLLGDTFAPLIFGIVEGIYSDPLLPKSAVDPVAREKTLIIFSLSLIPASMCCFMAYRFARRDEERALEAPLPK